MSSPDLSFNRAAYPGDAPPPDACSFCQRPLDSAYFRVNDRLACASCAQQARDLRPPDGHAAFVKALSFGAIAAILGCAAYATVVIVTGWTIGYLAIGVGWLIGWAMKKGANGHGGRRYQITAALLTYMAVSIAAIPVYLHFASEKHRASASATNDTSSAAGSSDTATPQQNTQSQKHTGVGGLLVALVTLVGIGLVSPILELTGNIASGLLNLIILVVGIRFAWRMMAQPPINVDGPYEPRPTTTT